MAIKVIDDLSECEAIWEELHPTPYLLDGWGLRTQLAAHDLVYPHFIRCTETRTTLPAGINDGKLVFFGGLSFSERNRFLGPKSGRSAVLAAVADIGIPIQLLNWMDDPLPYLPSFARKWDVPYNQYWRLPYFDNFCAYLDEFEGSKQKAIRYLVRRFEVCKTNILLGDLAQFLKNIDILLDQMARSFKKRGRQFQYEHHTRRQVLKICLQEFIQHASLWSLSVKFEGRLVGVGLMVEQAAVGEAVYFANFYRSTPNNVSGAVIISVIEHAIDRGLILDGIRGGFRLKPRYGFQPEPAYAVVNDSNWEVRLNNDLTKKEICDLYGRDFQAL